MCKVIQFAQNIGIRVIQLAGYDVYYQQASNEMCHRFRNGPKENVKTADRVQVTLTMEIVNYPLTSPISKTLGYAYYFNNPWFQPYPDTGGLSAWGNDVQMELQAGMDHIVAVYVKGVEPDAFKNVPFGEGVVGFERCFAALRQSGYHGPYLIEIWSETPDDPARRVTKVHDQVKACTASAGLVEAV